MTARVITEGEQRRVEIECDGCGAEAPPAAEIIKGHGLANMGWLCRNGEHICPPCRKARREA